MLAVISIKDVTRSILDISRHQPQLRYWFDEQVDHVLTAKRTHRSRDENKCPDFPPISGPIQIKESDSIEKMLELMNCYKVGAIIVTSEVTIITQITPLNNPAMINLEI